MLMMDQMQEGGAGHKTLDAYHEILTDVHQQLVMAGVSKLALARSYGACMALAGHLVEIDTDRLGIASYRNMAEAATIPGQAPNEDYAVILPTRTRAGKPIIGDRGGKTTEDLLSENDLAVLTEVNLPRHINRLKGPHSNHNVASFAIAVTLQHMSAYRYGMSARASEEASLY